MATSMEEGTLIPIGYDREVVLTPDLRMLHYPETYEFEGGWKLAHPCLSGTPGSPERMAITIAVALTPGKQGHRVTQEDPLTITPSLHCTACGLHGYVEYGTWRSV